jgi:hypothetical protein
MAASTTFKLDPANASTFAGTAMPGAQSFTMNAVGDETTLSSDGKPFVMGSFIDNLSYTVAVEFSQNPKSLLVGDTGVLILKAVERQNGEGVGSTSFTVTSGTACAVITSIDHTVSHSGNSSATVNFRVVSVDGTTNGFVIS